MDLLRPFPAEKMVSWPVSDRVGNVRYNDSQLLEQLQPIEDRQTMEDSSHDFKPAQPGNELDL